jgi:microcystin-dependent protein
MSEPFLAEVRIVGFNFAPRGWAQCDGQILPINQNQSLFSLLGTTYGGDGRTSFALPDLRSRVPIHTGASNGTGHGLGQRSGNETVAISEAEMPNHTHDITATTQTPASTVPGDNLLTRTSGGRRPVLPYSDASSPRTSLHAGSISTTGGQAHNNMQPYLALNFVIALQGLFPARN